MTAERAGLRPSALGVVTKGEAAYRELRTLILDGRLEPGSIINQEDLAATLGLSTTPLREALRRLEAEGLVGVAAYKDVTVAPLTRRELQELYSVRLQLDPFAAVLTATHASKEERKLILELAEAPAGHSPQERLRANRDFHRAIYVSSGNEVLIQILDSLWDRADRYRILLLKQEEQHARAAVEHRSIAAALQARDVRAVRKLMRQHVESTEALIRRLADGLK